MPIDQIIAPRFNEPPLDQIGRRFRRWTELVTELDILSGTGSPENVVEAKQKTLYMDETGISGAILYIKRDADIGGDRSQGWIAV